MLTGKPPYQGNNFPEIFNQHLEADIPKVREAVPDCPEALEKLIVELLAKNAEDRPSNAREVQGRIAEVLIDNKCGALVEALRKSTEAGTETIANLAKKGGVGHTAEEGFRKRVTILAAVVIGVIVVAAVIKGS